MATPEPAALSDDERALLQAIASGDEEEGVLAEDVQASLAAVGREVDEEWVEAELAKLAGQGLVAADELGTYLLTPAGWQALA